MAPEIVNSRVYDSKVDIWAIVVITYVLLSGKLPFGNREGVNLKEL